MAECFPSTVRWQDDPIADITGFGYYAVMRAAREHGVPVMLLGQGGDELFWGYPWVVEAVRQTVRKSLVEPPRGPRARDYLRLSWPALWPRRAMIDWVSSLAGLRSSWRALQRDRLSPRDRLVFYDLTPEFRAAHCHLGNLYGPRFRESLGPANPFALFTVSQPWPSIELLLTRLICQTYLLENGIAQGDRLSMASSVELRLPLVDYRLVETVVGLRKVRSDSGLMPKAWLREAVKDLLPEWVLRRPKRGFQPPVRAWMRAIFARYARLLDGGWLVQEGILIPEAGHRLSRGPWSYGDMAVPAFRALTLEVWCRESLSASLQAADRSTPSV
jgi:asparagine synthase (glutamine-hydrolysing)